MASGCEQGLSYFPYRHTYIWLNRGIVLLQEHGKLPCQVLDVGSSFPNRLFRFVAILTHPRLGHLCQIFSPRLQGLMDLFEFVQK